jgi:alkyldihydroxyacetonephosphate synthase
VRFPSLREGAEAVRAITGAGLRPANCRLLDPLEAAFSAGGDGRQALLLLAFESAGHDVTAWLRAALALAGAHGGTCGEIRGHGPGGQGAPGDPGGSRGAGGAGGPGGEAGRWRDAFLQAPYLRNSFPALGIIAETFESAVTWDRFGAFHEAVTAAAQQAARRVCGAAPAVTCRFAFAYPDGPAPYYTVLVPGRRGEEAAQWDAIKAAVSEAILAAGGTITHHHAVGRDHRPWYDRQRPGPFAAALRAAKAALDPHAILNPGVLVDP